MAEYLEDGHPAVRSAEAFFRDLGIGVAYDMTGRKFELQVGPDQLVALRDCVSAEMYDRALELAKRRIRG